MLLEHIVHIKNIKNVALHVSTPLGHLQATHLLRHHTKTDKCYNSGIYQIKFLDSPLKYIGQTGRMYKIRYKEHIQAIRNNNSN
jgi:hypothetical protein